jgi:phospholipase C
MAATSFGHLTTSDTFPPPGGYKPITGTIFDLFDKSNVTWADYFQDAPQGGSFRQFNAAAIDPHFLPLKVFLAQAAGTPGLPPLPDVSFVDPNFGLFGRRFENDEHPPTDIQRGQAYVSQVLSAVRNGPFWQDSVIFITYDEHGGYYDHASAPQARQGGARTLTV